MSELVSIDQSAARLSVTVGTTRHRRPRGTGRWSARVGRHVIHRLGDLDQWVRDCSTADHNEVSAA